MYLGKTCPSEISDTYLFVTAIDCRSLLCIWNRKINIEGCYIVQQKVIRLEVY